jgi:hypothetical protein
VVKAGRQISRDAGLIADYSKGLKLDLAMINLALRDPDTDDEEKLAERERAKQKVREAAAPGDAPSDAASPPDGGPKPAAPAYAAGGGTYATTAAPATPAAAAATEREMPGEVVRADDVDATLAEAEATMRKRHGSA